MGIHIPGMVAHPAAHFEDHSLVNPRSATIPSRTVLAFGESGPE
jgi:hypothetical protein